MLVVSVFVRKIIIDFHRIESISFSIKDAIKYLHQQRLVWGYAKAGNILINKHRDAISVDFGGGFTDGWVDQEYCETIDGDLQGLRRIVSFIDRIKNTS